MVRNDHDETQPLMTGPEQHPVDVGVVPVSGPGSDSDNDNGNGDGNNINNNEAVRARNNHNSNNSIINSSSITRTPDTSHPDAPLDGVEVESRPPTPRFLQDEGSWKRWRWVPYSVRRVSKRIAKWARGPPNPQPYRITPLFPAVQEYPLYLVDRFLPQLKHRLWLLSLYLAVWLLTFALVKRDGLLATEIAGWGAPQNIGCGVTYWGAGNHCGIDGSDCRPFSGSGFPFRCSANCESYHVLNPRAVGDHEVIYRPLVIGGPHGDGLNGTMAYRGDSYICGAAIHAGVISNSQGGCGVVELVGHQSNFVGTKRNGIRSVPFDSYFPLAFRFTEDISCSATDKRWELLAVSAVFTGVLSLCTASPALFFFPTFIGIFWTTGMAMDPPPSKTIASLFSIILGKFVPAMFCAWVMYDKMGVRRTLFGLTAQIEKSILWLGACWVGALDNYTLSFIPIQRLTGHDLAQQPGAKAALAIIVIILFVLVVSQVYFFQKEGRLIKYLKLYALFIFAILISLTIPGLNLRIHHYILALLLLPGTSLQTRPSLLYQGLLVGLFINGIARWGFHPVLQTPLALQGDAQKGTALPVVHPPEIQWSTAPNALSNITFKWDPPPGQRYHGISILVNDVERFRSYFEDSFEKKERFVWTRNSSVQLPEYFRGFAFLEGSRSGDYTKAGVWDVDGDWQKMKPGPSSITARSLDVEDIVRR